MSRQNEVKDGENCYLLLVPFFSSTVTQSYRLTEVLCRDQYVSNKLHIALHYDVMNCARVLRILTGHNLLAILRRFLSKMKFSQTKVGKKLWTSRRQGKQTFTIKRKN